MQLGEKCSARHPFLAVVYRCSRVLVVLVARLVSVSFKVLEVILVVTLFMFVWWTRVLILGFSAIVSRTVRL